MATLTQLSTSNLALKGAGDEYNYINRFFATKAEADAALADSSWTPVAGKLNACLTGDQGLLVYNETTSSLDLADTATRAYIDAQIGALVGDAPEVLDTLGEISDALNDNPNYFTDAAAATAANTALINAESGRAVAAENAIQADVDQNEADADAAIAALQAEVNTNEADVEDKISDVNTALGLSVGDTSFSFTEDLIVVDLDPARATDHAGIYSDITTTGPDAAQNLDIRTALERFAHNSRIILAAEKYRLDLEDARMDGLVGVDGSNLGTFAGSTIADNTNVKDALQSLETITEGEISDRKTYFDWQSNLTQIINPLRSSKIEVGNNIQVNPATGFATQFNGNVEFDNNTTLSHGGTALTADFSELNYTGDLGTFTKGFISDNTDVKSALQEVSDSLSVIQSQARVQNYKWSNNNDATITEKYITTDATNWADATKVYIHRKARHNVDMQNAFNNMLIDGARLYIQKTDDADKFFAANIDSAFPIVTGTGTDQVFEYSVTNVSTIGTVFNDNVEVSVGVFSNVNAKMLAAVQADVDQNEADADAAIATLQADVDQNESDADAAIASLQADVDQNESDADAAIAAETTARTSAITALQADVDQNESDADSAIAAVQADVDANEAASIASLALKAPLDSPALTGTPTAPTASQSSGTTQVATTAYVDTAVANLIDSAPGALDTLKELADAIGDDSNFSTTITNSITAVQNDVNQNEIDSDAADTALSGRLDTLEADPTTSAAVAAVQADVDQNEADADSAIAALQADVDQNESDADAAIAALQADVDQNESDADTAIAAVQADVDANETASDAAEATLSGRLDTLEVDPVTKTYVDGTTTTEALTRQAQDTTLQGNIDAIQADVDQNESDADAAIAAVQADVDQNETDGDAADAALGVRIDEIEDGFAFQGDISTTNNLTVTGTSDFNGTVTAHDITIDAGGDDAVLKFTLETDGGVDKGGLVWNRASGGADIGAITYHRSLDSIRFYTNGTTNFDVEIGSGGELNAQNGLSIGGTSVTATAAELNYVDGVTSNVQTQLDAIQADVDQNESDADSAIAAVQADVDQNESDADAAIALKADIDGPTFTGVPAAPTAAAGTNSTQVATTAFVTTAVANVIDSAPGALDTLNELAAALGDDANFSTTITNAINANETHIDNAVTLTGVAKDATNLGTFTGSTVSDSRTIKQAVQELESAVEAAQANVVSTDTVKTQIAANSANYFLTFVDSNNVSATAEAVKTGTHLKFNPSTKVLDISSGTVHAKYLTLDNVNVDATATELNVLDGITATTAELNYVDGVTSNIQTQLNAIQADVDTNEADADASISTLQTHTGNQETTLGVAATATHFGTFTGSTINDNVNAKQALQALETAVEATQADVDQNESDADAAIAAVLAGTSIPGPYNNDSDAGSGGVAVGAIYKNSNGSLHWRVS